MAVGRKKFGPDSGDRLITVLMFSHVVDIHPQRHLCVPAVDETTSRRAGAGD